MPASSIYRKRQPQRVIDTPRDRVLHTSHSDTPYAELHCKTNFSFLEGASHPDELAIQAQALGYSALAITDRNSLAGVVRAHAAAKEAGLKLLIGAEIMLTDGPPVVLLSPDRAAYGQLCRLITTGRRRAPKGECELVFDDLIDHGEGLLALVIPGYGDELCDEAVLHDYRQLFGDRCYLLAELHLGTDDERRLDGLVQLAKRSRIPLAAAGDVHYHVPQRMVLQHVLTAIRHGTTVAELGERAMSNAERHLRPREDINSIFFRAPDAVRRAVEIANRCTFSLDELRYEYPEELAPPGETPVQYLRRLTWQGARKRYSERIPEKVRHQLEHELQLVEELRYEAFFLTVHDLVEFAKSRNILCQGRGSAANSSICYCLGVTAVDPQETDLLFERFVSRERNEAPDIDVDFEHERREEVLQYVYQKYGRERAGMTAVVITYRPRSAIRDVGKALGLSLDRVDALAKNIDFRSEHELFAQRSQQTGIDPDSRLGRQLISLVNELLGFPRHLSQHVGGMVITQGSLCELVPLENAAMADRTVIQWDKDDLNELGILKVDCLALGMLTAIHKCFDLIEQHRDIQIAISDFVDNQNPHVDAQDSRVYEMISRADTIGVFQIESRAQMSMLPRLRPKCFYDLVIEVAIVRPGPIQGNMVHPYLRRRELSPEDREREITEDACADVELREVLKRTLGVPLFQEQAMQVAIVAAGFSAGDADQLRRAMGGWRRPGLIDDFYKKLIDGMLAKGYPESFAERLFQQIRGFGEYGFPESHAASFAKLVYVSAWLKCHYPAAFTASLINSQPMGFYAPAQLVRDAQEHGIEVLPIDVNHSDWDCTLERSSNDSSQLALRLGMRLVRGLSQAAGEQIMHSRETGFRSIAELTARARLDRTAVQHLSEADAFGSLQLDRRTALWHVLDQAPKPEKLPLFQNEPCEDALPPTLSKLSPQAEVMADYRAAGLSLRQHPLSFCREKLDGLRALPAAKLRACRHNSYVSVAGLVLMRQRPSTAKGITFFTLEDETGIANLIVHQHTMRRFDLIARRAKLLLVHGTLERQNEVIHIIVRRMQDITAWHSRLNHHSRDFR